MTTPEAPTADVTAEWPVGLRLIDREGEEWEWLADCLPFPLPVGRAWLAEDSRRPWLRLLGSSVVMPLTDDDPMRSAHDRYGPFTRKDRLQVPIGSRDGASILPCCDGRTTHGHIGCVWPTGKGEPSIECLYGTECGGGAKRPCWMQPETCPECTGWRGAHGVTCSRRP